MKFLNTRIGLPSLHLSPASPFHWRNVRPVLVNVVGPVRWVLARNVTQPISLLSPGFKATHTITLTHQISSCANNYHILGSNPTGWIHSRGRRPGEQFSLYWYLWGCLHINIVNSLLSSWTWSNHKRTKYYWPQVTTSPALVLRRVKCDSLIPVLVLFQ